MLVSISEYSKTQKRVIAINTSILCVVFNMATLIPCTGTGKDTPGSVITGEQILLPGRPGHNRFCMVIDNVLNSDECKEWIRIADNVGYKEAVVNIGGGREILDQNYRRGERSIIDDQSMSQLVYKRISAYLPTSYAEALVSIVHCLLNGGTIEISH